MLIWLIIVPILSCALIGFLHTPGRITAILSAAVSLILATAVICVPEWGGDMCGLTIKLPLSPAMLLLTAIVTFSAVSGMHAPDARAERSWAVSALLISAGATGAFISTNLIVAYAFHELALIPTFIMIGCYGRGERRTVAWRAVLYLGAASMVLLAGLAMLGSVMATFDIQEIYTGFRQYADAPEKIRGSAVISGLLLLGFGIPVSLFPFHSWAAPAYASAPAPIAMLHAGVLKKFGLYGLFTIAWALGNRCGAFFGYWSNLLLILLLGNVLWVGYVTVAQTRLDKMLGNSSVMHMGYLFLAFAAFAETNGCNLAAFSGASILMFAHGISIALLFLLAGQIEQQTRTLELSALGGLGQKLPNLGFLFGIGGMAAIGLPLLANFVGEFTIFASCFNMWQPSAADAVTEGFCGQIAAFFGGLGPVQLTLLFALWGLVISAVYMLRAIRTIFAGQVTPAAARAGKLSCADVVSAGLLATVLVIFGVMPGLLF